VRILDSRRAIARRSVFVLCAALVLLALGAAPLLARPAFTPSLVLSDENMRDYDSMSAAQVQAFLNSRPGPLKRMSFPRHDGGSVAPASVIIWEASQAYHINPRVLLTLLQKEQSLITRRSLAKQTLNRAIGAGCPDSGGNRYPGFGNQMWQGARLLDGYGEEGKTTEYVPHPWTPGMKNKFTRSVPTSDLATYKLYVYNPSIGAKWPYGDLSKQSCAGNANFWKIYWSYFGDPLSTPSGPVVPSGVTTTTIELAQPFSRVAWGQPARIAGRLACATSTVSPEGASLALQTLSGSTWVPTGAVSVVASDGVFSFPLPAEHTERVRVVFSGTSTLAASESGCFVSDVVPVVSAPRVPTAARAKRTIVIRGGLAPAHASSVKVSLYKVSKGKKRLWKSYYAKTSQGGAWTLKVRLAKGAWAVRANHNDSGHASATSAWSSLKVR
jgi:hypothetical protein